MSRAGLAAAVAGAVTTVPGVARLSPGGPVEVATQHAGGKVIGVSLTDPHAVTVHLVADRLPLTVVAESARAAAQAALRTQGDGRRVDIVIDDLVLPGQPPPDRTAPGLGPPVVVEVWEVPSG